LKYWRIVAGHPERGQPDDVKSVQLGDWLRKDYIAIGHRKSHQLHKTFRDDAEIGDQVVVTTDRHIWALGTIAGNEIEKDIPKGSYLYSYRRDVVWSKLMKVPHTRFPDALRRKLGIQQTISELTPDDWATLLLFV